MNWEYIHIDSKDVMVMSGWKLYISGETVSQAKLVASLLKDIVVKYNLTTKISTDEIIKRNMGKDIAWGIMVIYLTDEAVKHLDDIIAEISLKLKDYHPSREIIGAYRITSKIYCRYDMSIPINPRIGVEYDTYLSLYRGESGPYNISGNKDVVTHKGPYNCP